MRIMIVTCMKNEGPFLLEWIAYHKALGVTDFLVWFNDCSDGTDRMLQRLGELGHGVTALVNKPGRRGIQKSALFRSNFRADVQAADWLLVLDCDEFVNVHAEGHDLSGLIAATGDPNAIFMTWRLFGDGGVDAYRDRFVTEQFVRAAPQNMPRPPQAWGMKTLWKNDGGFQRLGVHRPLMPDPDRREALRLVNGSGQPLPDPNRFAGFRSTKDSVGYELVQINHYAVRSIDSYLVKRDRGRVNHTGHDQGLAYWRMMSHNHEEDRSILPRLGPAKAQFDAFMADEEIARLHAGACAWHRTKARTLRADPGFQPLLEGLAKLTGRPQEAA